MQMIRLLILALLLSVYTLLGLSCTAEQAPDLPAILYHKSIRDRQVIKHELWSTSPGNRKPIRLSENGWYAAYSPEYTQVAYSEFYDQGIWVMNADGSGAVQLNTIGGGPAWSPDGKKLAYHVGGTAGKNRSVWVMNADGTDADQISSVPGSFPDWSPDGSLILFHGEVNSGIWQIASDGSGEKLLYRYGGYPVWSPDGEQVAYISLTDWYLWVMNKDGTGNRKLTDHGSGQPAWSADGQWIAYQRIEKKQGDKSQTNIWIINVDGSGNRKVIEDGLHPDWSK